ncbi:MAG TPA: glucans biosynthesis glucosyltransferase MdoH [Burkholderiales bacterium]|nr:glucans biosynthesis glucosyltransferase MdoH [Burkholderiales bacterium]
MRDTAGACRRYLERLRFLPSGGRRGSGTVAPADAPTTMSAVHGVLSNREVDPRDPAGASYERRLEAAIGVEYSAAAKQVLLRDAQGRLRLNTGPAINRSSMIPRRWPPKFWQVKSWWRRPMRDRRADSPDPLGRWHGVGSRRRIILGLLVVAQTVFATDFMTAVLPYHGRQPLEIAILALFAILFCWVSAGFWTAVMGFIIQAIGGDRYAISRTAAGDAPIDASARTAIIMPICNEDVPRVFAGLRATYESLAATGDLRHFDFVVLSDSSDADKRVAERQAWLALCRAVGGFGRVFYRWRQHRIKRKSGNVADFCRRWGAHYRYMVVLDADSVMSGDCLVRLVQLMEANPNAGIIQTAPRAAGRDTLYARMQQFATRVYGPLFTAGLHFWQLGESHYWGHNAIIRVAPFIKHCALGRLPGQGTLSGEILSHDFVEAALMRRAGWAVWLAYDLPGSYEEMPPNLVDELKRDRRWCHGNLINFRLFLAEGLHPAHRAVFVTGVMAYCSALLWFVFLLLSTALLAVHTLVEPQYFVSPKQLFPIWPEWHIERALALWSVTAVVLFLPKILSVVLIWIQGAREFGGPLRLTASMVLEALSSMLLAPVRMLFHTEFVVTALAGLRAQWKSPPREDAETTWGEAIRRHGVHSLIGVVWAAGVFWLNPSFLWWLLPVVGALMLSIPMSVYSSRISFGRATRRAGLFVIPEEADAPEELRRMELHLRQTGPLPGFTDAVVDPLVHALACASANMRRFQPPQLVASRSQLEAGALVGGPDALNNRQRADLLGDPTALSRLHYEVWSSPSAHPAWLGDVDPTMKVLSDPAASPVTEPAPVTPDAPVASPPAPVPAAAG